MEEAVSALCKLFKTDILAVSTNGAISREVYAAGHRDENFYMLGSMGHASSIALGISLARPEKRVVVFDGDGSLIMNMGILATVRQYRPRNFFHVVLDNAAYNTTGGQTTAAAVVDLGKVAKAAGYRHVAVVKTYSQLRRSGKKILAGKGPAKVAGCSQLLAEDRVQSLIAFRRSLLVISRSFASGVGLSWTRTGPWYIACGQLSRREKPGIIPIRERAD